MPIAQQESLVREAERDNIVGGSAASGLEEFLQVKPELYEGPLGIGTKGDEPFPIRVSVVQSALQGTMSTLCPKCGTPPTQSLLNLWTISPIRSARVMYV